MPGLVGFLKSKRLEKAHLEAARGRLWHRAFYVDDPIFENDFLIASRTHLNLIGEKKSPQIPDNQRVVWVEGEAYNLVALGEPPNLGLALGRALAENRLEKLLEKIDGYFVAAIFDGSKKELLLVSDRLGMKPLYFWKTAKNFGWASEAKAFLEHPDFEKKLDLMAGKMLLDLGHLVGDGTWFESVKLLDAATILTYSIDNQQVTKRRYWHWSKIQPSKMAFPDAAQAVGEVLKKAVRERFEPMLKTAISLSGGLDSRAILAALGPDFSVSTFSYGEKNCLDLRLAAEAAAVAKASNHPLLIDEKNWMRGRQHGVLANDGQYSWLHLHWTPFEKAVSPFCELNLSGFVGDVVLGGGHFRQKDRRVDLDFARKKLGRWADSVALDNPFYDLEKQDPFVLDQRNRRFTRGGSVEIETRLAQRKPFIANDLIELVYALPDDFRQHNRLYSAALLRSFPAFFERIAWAKTGVPIAQKQKTFLLKALKIRQLQRKAGLWNNVDVGYPRLTRTAKAAAFFAEMLDPKKAVYPDFFSDDFQQKWLEPHLAGRADFSEKIGRAVALETWLRYIFAPEKLIVDDET